MQDEAVMGILSKTEIARGLARADLELVLAHAQIETVDIGTVVIAEGQPGKVAYVVLTGALKVMLLKEAAGPIANRSTDIQVATLSPGDCFGEYSLIDSEPTSATVVSTERSKLLKITRGNFRQIDATQARIAKTIYCNLLHILVRRLRKKDKELDLNLDID